jgi:hypothetical protein
MRSEGGEYVRLRDPLTLQKVLKISFGQWVMVVDLVAQLPAGSYVARG